MAATNVTTPMATPEERMRSANEGRPYGLDPSKLALPGHDLAGASVSKANRIVLIFPLREGA
jgi:hypothetical protein